MTEAELFRLAADGQPLAWRKDGNLYRWSGGKYHRVTGLILSRKGAA